MNDLSNDNLGLIYNKLASIDNKLDNLLMVSGLLMIANNDLVSKEQRSEALNRAMTQLGLNQTQEVNRPNALPNDMIR